MLKPQPNRNMPMERFNGPKNGTIEEPQGKNKQTTKQRNQPVKPVEQNGNRQRTNLLY